MRTSSKNRGFKLIEVMFTTVLISVLGLLIYSILNASSVLGAKNTAVNTAHQQARVAMLQMVQDLHAVASLPYLTNVSNNQAAGISFQQWGAVPIAGKGMVSNGGPHKIIADADAGDTFIRISVTAGPNITSTQSMPVVGQRVIIPTHQIEADISAVSGPATNAKLTLKNIYGPAAPTVIYPVNSLPIDISGTGSTVGDVVCYIMDRCSYSVANNTLNWTFGTTANTTLPLSSPVPSPIPTPIPRTDLASMFPKTMASDIANSAGVLYDSTKAGPPTNPNNYSPSPFSIPVTVAGAMYYRSVSAIDLSTADDRSNQRGYKSANILLNGQVPYKARLTTFQ